MEVRREILPQIARDNDAIKRMVNQWTGFSILMLRGMGKYVRFLLRGECGVSQIIRCEIKNLSPPRSMQSEKVLMCACGTLPFLTHFFLRDSAKLKEKECENKCGSYSPCLYVIFQAQARPRTNQSLAIMEASRTEILFLFFRIIILIYWDVRSILFCP